MDQATINKLCRFNSATSLARLTRTKIEYGFSFCYFDGTFAPIQYRDSKELLAKRVTPEALKKELERIAETYS